MGRAQFKMRTGLTWTVLCALILGRVGAFYPDDSYIDDDSDKFLDPTDEYDDKMSHIFGENGAIKVDEDAKARLDSCNHVVCAPYYLCNNSAVVTNDTDSVEWRSATPGHNADDDEDVLVCDNLEVPCCADKLISAPLSIAINPNNLGEMVEHSDAEPFDEMAIVPSIGQCGFQLNDRYSMYRRLIARGVRGETAEPMEFPWMVGIFKRMNNGRLQYLGGGAIIHSNVVVTAAHFLFRLQPDQIVIRAGVFDIQKPISLSERQQQQQRNVSRLIIHDELMAYSLINDIALLVVSKPLEWSRYVNPICLPPPNVRSHIGTECMASGWGKDSIGRSGAYQRLLQKIELPIVEAASCQRLLRSTRLGPYFRLHPSLLCAGGSGRDTCKGDGGSPLICPIPYLNNRFYLCGIVAGGIGCGGHMPALYVDVAHFVDWINEQLWQLNLGIEQPNVLAHNLFDTN